MYSGFDRGVFRILQGHIQDFTGAYSGFYRGIFRIFMSGVTKCFFINKKKKYKQVNI